MNYNNTSIIIGNNFPNKMLSCFRCNTGRSTNVSFAAGYNTNPYQRIYIGNDTIQFNLQNFVSNNNDIHLQNNGNTVSLKIDTAGIYTFVLSYSANINAYIPVNPPFDGDFIVEYNINNGSYVQLNQLNVVDNINIVQNLSINLAAGSIINFRIRFTSNKTAVYIGTNIESITAIKSG